MSNLHISFHEPHRRPQLPGVPDARAYASETLAGITAGADSVSAIATFGLTEIILVADALTYVALGVGTPDASGDVRLLIAPNEPQSFYAPDGFKVAARLLA